MRRVPSSFTRLRRAIGLVLAALAATLALVGCSEDGSDDADGGSSTSASSEGRPSTADADHPEILEAELSDEGGSFSVAVTISSEYDSPERYADGWRVLDADGNELGTMELGHDHASEQPFTRTQTGLEIPAGVDEVTIEGHDLENGYGGGTVTVAVPR